MVAPSLLFGGDPTLAAPGQLHQGAPLPAGEIVKRFEAYKGALDDEARAVVRGEVSLAGAAQRAPGGALAFDQQTLLANEGRMLVKTPTVRQHLETLAAPQPGRGGMLTKGVSLGADFLASISGELARLKAAEADLVKDLSLTTPLSTGLVAFDLEAPSKKIFPRMTPLRNRVPRQRGIGTSRRFKRITGISGTGTGVATIRPGITDATTTAFGSLNLIRGSKVGYQADEKTIPYKQNSISDLVNWSAQFAGQGYEDLRQLSQTTVLYASMLSEERLILNGRGTDSGFVGALAVPAGVTLAVRAAVAGETGNSANIASYFVYVTAENGEFGESNSSTVVSTTGMAASTGNVVDVTIGTDVAGATGYKVYAGTVTGQANAFFIGRTGYNKFTIQFTGGGTGGAINTGATAPTTDTSGSAQDYDGLLSILGGGSSIAGAAGYSTRINSAFSSTNPGSELETAFSAMWVANKADPDDAFLAGQDRKQLSDLLKTASSANYRLAISQSETGNAVLGSVVVGIQNEVTGKMVNLEVLPWLVQGNAMIASWTLPFPDSQVPSTVEMTNVQDYMAVQWPVIQFTYDISSYWFGNLTFYAPSYWGLIQGVKLV